MYFFTTRSLAVCYRLAKRFTRNSIRFTEKFLTRNNVHAFHTTRFGQAFFSIDFRFKQIISDFFSDSKDCLKNGRENKKKMTFNEYTFFYIDIKKTPISNHY